MNNPNNSPWTDERTERLKTMWKDGNSAAEIALSLGNGITRNAVLGKVHKLELASHGRNVRLTKKQEQVKAMKLRMGDAYVSPAKKATARPKPIPLLEPKPLPLVGGQAVTVLHLSEDTCKWPIGHPHEHDFCFCGHRPRENSSYCEYHARIAHQPAQDRRMVRASPQA